MNKVQKNLKKKSQYMTLRRVFSESHYLVSVAITASFLFQTFCKADLVGLGLRIMRPPAGTGAPTPLH